MWTATCNNGGCEKDEWTLTKHPDDYARGVTCPECGTTRVEVGGGGDTPRREGSEQRGAQRPEIHRDQRGQNEANLPQQHEGGTQVGGALADAAVTVADGSAGTQDRLQSLQALGSVFIGATDRLREHKDARERAKRERAKNADLQQVDEYPSCQKCDYQFNPDELARESVTCPKCGMTYQVM